MTTATYLLLTTTFVCPILRAAPGVKGEAPTAKSQVQTVEWDTAFADRSNNTPVHFTARYFDSRHQPHRLEEWRIGLQRLRRRTDDRIDLHADADPSNAAPNSARLAANQPLDYTWQILDLQKRIAHRVSTAGMMHLGMLYSYYSMAHVLTRPAGRFTVVPSSDPSAVARAGTVQTGPAPAKQRPCAWWQIDAPGQPATRVCWLSRYGVPTAIWSQTNEGWRLTFQIDTVDTLPIPSTIFAANTVGFQVRDVDEIESED